MKASISRPARRIVRLQGIELQVSQHKHAALVVVNPAAERLHASEKFLQRERLDQVVVGTAAQALDSIRDRIAGGQKQNVDVVAFPSERGEDPRPSSFGSMISSTTTS